MCLYSYTYITTYIHIVTYIYVLIHYIHTYSILTYVQLYTYIYIQTYITNVKSGERIFEDSLNYSYSCNFCVSKEVVASE